MASTLVSHGTVEIERPSSLSRPLKASGLEARRGRQEPGVHGRVDGHAQEAGQAFGDDLRAIVTCNMGRTGWVGGGGGGAGFSVGLNLFYFIF